MKILFFLVHPAHFHLFKNVIQQLKSNGHSVTILIKTKDILEHLVRSEKWEFINVQSKARTAKGKYGVLVSAVLGLIKRQYRLTRVILKDRPDLLIGSEWAIAHVGKLFGIASILVNEDDTKATPENRFFYPFARNILLPACCDIGKWGNKKITYEGYHELAYLHPNHFVARNEVVKKFNPNSKPYSILRLVSLTASHDIGKSGITNELVKRIISILEKGSRVYISSERQLPKEFEKYRINIPPSDMLHALNFAEIFVGDSQTMVAEAAVLGIPALRFNDFVGKLGYLEELETKYQLTFGFRTSESRLLIKKLFELTNMPGLKEEWQRRRKYMLADKIDVSSFMVWFIENHPGSVTVMKKDPDFQYNFR